MKEVLKRKPEFQTPCCSRTTFGAVVGAFFIALSLLKVAARLATMHPIYNLTRRPSGRREVRPY